MTDVLYRYDIVTEVQVRHIKLSQFRIKRITPCFYWINDYRKGKIGQLRRVSKTGKSSFAKITKIQALNSFVHRKNKQVEILAYQLKNATEALNAVDLVNFNINKTLYY